MLVYQYENRFKTIMALEIFGAYAHMFIINEVRTEKANACSPWIFCLLSQ